MFILRDVVRTYVSFSFLSLLDILFMYLRSCDHVVIANLVLIDIYIHLRLLLQFLHLSLHVLFLFFLNTHVSYLMHAIYYFCFTLIYRDEFCLKCFRNTCYQSLPAINSLLEKFFKSLCYDRFYCIQQMNMS